MTDNAIVPDAGDAHADTLPHQAPPAALAAVQEIRLLQGVVSQISQFVEARLMECLWKIRQVIPEKDDFIPFVKAHLDMEAETAWQYAVTWDVARDNRHLRSLAQTAPDDALRLVRESVEAGSGEKMDERVTKMLSLPSRRRYEALKELIDNDHLARDGHNPADQEEIRGLKAERDELLALRGDTRLAPLTRQARAITEQVTDLIANTRAVEHDVRFLHTQRVEGITASVRIEMGHLLPQLDALSRLVDDVAARCQQIIDTDHTHE